ncbi:MAG TPA: endonuclease/exonuclease/phosphatase family protein [bacterium]|nr:endonuclease/exonuclease/phosphatase family protein [bacterium]
MNRFTAIRRFLASALFFFWVIILAAEALVWGNLRVLFLPRVPTVEMAASLLQDTLWLFAGLALPLYLLVLAHRQTPRPALRRVLLAAIVLLEICALADLPAYFRGLFLLLGLLAFLAVRDARRSRKLRAHYFLFYIACLGLLLNYGPQLFPSFSALRRPGPGHLKILDFNISSTSYGEKRTPVFDLIEREAPDLVFIQEINSSDQKLFRRRLGERYPHQLWADRFENYNGGAILSRIPFKEDHNIDLGTPYMSGHTNINHAVIRVRGEEIHLFNGHLYPAGHAFLQLIFGRRTLESSLAQTRIAYQRRMAEAEQLENIIRRYEGPVIVAGDFNDTPNSPLYRRFSETLHNAFATAGWGLGTTYGQFNLNGSVPQGLRFVLFDFLRIDQVFASRHFRILEARVVPLAISDHKPQVVRLTLY